MKLVYNRRVGKVLEHPADSHQAPTVRGGQVMAIHQSSPATISTATGKACRCCGESKALTDFASDRRNPDGHTRICKDCYNSRRIGRRIQDTTHSLRWMRENREKRQAEVAAQAAVRRGALVRPDSCSRCGRVGRVHGHHDDYSQPLAVRWLCPKCHRFVHDSEKPRAEAPKRRQRYAIRRPVISLNDAVQMVNPRHPNARKTHCPNGHEYSADNSAVTLKPNGRPTRRCRACEAERSLRRVAKDRERRQLARWEFARVLAQKLCEVA